MIDLRPIGIYDVEWIRLLRNRNLSHFVDMAYISAHEQRIWFQRYTYKKNFEFFIIMKDHEKAGTVSVLSLDKYRQIGNLIVDEQFRKQGIYTKVFEIIDHRYARPIIIEITSANKLALQIHKRFGFIERSVTLQLI